MPITADYHLHSSFSGDSETPMEEMVKQGIALGLSDLCFTEHLDLGFPQAPEAAEAPAGQFEVNVDSYLYDLIRYGEKYAGQISLHFGIELGLQPEQAKANAKAAKEHNFDFIIGSSHACHGRDPYYPSFYEGREEEEAYREYFSSILENIRAFTNFDVYGHLDYVVRYGPQKDAEYTYYKYRDLLDQILEALLDREKGLELNTGALAYGLRELNPCTDVLKKYRSLGGEIITVGSDAHSPEDMARGFDRAAEILKDCGFGYYCTFEKRTPSYHKL